MIKQKKIVASFLLFAFCFLLKSQTNLVPNPSFENYNSCPTNNADIYECSNWKTFGNSSDYYNGCATSSSGVNVPNTFAGFQYAHTGVAMGGVEMYTNPSNSPNGPNYREFIGAQLTNTLTIGQKYFFSFFINFSGFNHYQAIACNKMGLRFSTKPSDSLQHCSINNFAHLYTDSIIKDTINWLKLSGSFIADSVYKYIAIGNFFDDAHTDTFVVGIYHYASLDAYYFVDDVCVSTDSLYNQTWTGIETIKNGQSNKINVFPNPVSDILTINATENIEQVQLINSIGQIVFSTEIKNDSSFKFSISIIPSGIYVLRIKTKNNLSSSTINIIH